MDLEFIHEVDSYLAEAEALATTELLFKEETKQIELNKNKVVLDSLLEDPALLDEYGHKIIKRHREIAPLLNKIPTGCDKNIIELTIGAYDCTYNQAITKLALALDINYNHETWFMKQWRILQHNKELLSNPTAIITKHNRLWHKIKQNANMRKYFIFLLDLFQTQLEHLGISYKGYKKPLIASASFSFITKSLKKTDNISKDHIETTKQNINSIARLTMTKKLSDLEVQKIDSVRFEQILSLTKGFRRTITSYELILWDDTLLDIAEQILDENKRKQVTHKGQCHQMFSAVGSDDVFSKAIKDMSDEDKRNINSLKKWARQRIYEKGHAGFFTKQDWESRFNDNTKQNTIYVGIDKMNTYKTIVLTQLHLEAVQATKELKAVMNSAKLDKVDYHQYVYVPADIAAKLKGGK